MNKQQRAELRAVAEKAMAAGGYDEELLGRDLPEQLIALLACIDDALGALERIAAAAPDNEVPDPHDEEAADKWWDLAKKRRKIAQAVLAKWADGKGE